MCWVMCSGKDFVKIITLELLPVIEGMALRPTCRYMQHEGVGFCSSVCKVRYHVVDFHSEADSLS
jgi:hypothetical protein